MPLVDVVPAPPAPPSILNDIESISVFLNTPAYVQRSIQDLTLLKFLTPILFGQGPAATSGAVAYDQVTQNDLFTGRDVSKIAPGAEYPILTVQAPTPKMALVDKWGGRVQIFDETVRRGNFNAVLKAFTKLGNTIVRKADTQGLAVLAAAPTLTYGFSATWASSTFAAIIDGLIAAKQLVEQQQMGYVVDTLVLSLSEANRLLSLAIQNKALGEVAQAELVHAGDIGQILGFDIFATALQAQGSGYFLARKQIGDFSDEVPLTTKSYREEETDSQWVQGSRSFTAYVTDPKACVTLTGM